VAISSLLLATHGIIPLIQWLFISTKDASVLEAKLGLSTRGTNTIKLFETTDSINDIITEDALITAWDLNNRSPRLFSKWSYKNIQGVATGP